MSEPLYSVGQSVALCQTHPGEQLCVIPATVVTGVWPILPGDIHTHPNGERIRYTGPGEHMYSVRGSDLIHGENLLRPINPDTEYLDQPESVEQPA